MTAAYVGTKNATWTYIPFKLRIKCRVERFNDVELFNNTENH